MECLSAAAESWGGFEVSVQETLWGKGKESHAMGELAKLKITDILVVYA